MVRPIFARVLCLACWFCLFRTVPEKIHSYMYIQYDYLGNSIQYQRTSGPVNAHLTTVPGMYFNAFIHVYSPRAGADNPLGTNADVNRKPLSLCPFVASSKTISIRFFMFFHMYIAPDRGRQTPGVKILMSTERPYHFEHLLQVLKNSLWSLILCIFFNVFMHVYSPRPGADNPLVTKFWRQQKAQINLTICCKFQNDLFEF